MPLTKRQPQPPRLIPSTPPSLLPLVPAPSTSLSTRRTSTSKHPSGSFGRWRRERTTSAKGKERAVVVDEGSDAAPKGYWGNERDESDQTTEVGEGSVRARTGRAVEPDPLVDADAQPRALQVRASDPHLRAELRSAVPALRSTNPAATPYPSLPLADHANLFRSLSLLSTAPTHLTSDSSDPLIPPFIVPSGPPRKLVKRRPSVTLHTRALPLLDVSPPTPFRLTEKHTIPALPLPLGAQAPLADPFTPLLSSSLSRNGSSSTTTSSLDPLSASNSGDSTQGLITPRDDDLADQPPREISQQPNRDTFGPIADDVEIAFYDDSTPLAGGSQGDDLNPPRFWNDTSSTLDNTPSTTTSSSGRTAQPLRGSPGLERPKSPFSAQDHGRPPDPLSETSRRQRVTSASGRREEAPARFPSIYDLNEILRVGGSAPVPTHSGGSRPRSSSTGTIPDWSRSLTRGLEEISAEEQEILDFLARRDDPPRSKLADPPGLRPIFHSRPAPAPPHLASVVVTPPSIGTDLAGSSEAGPSTRHYVSRSGSQLGGGEVKMDAPVIPDRSSSLGLLWRRMSGRGGSRQSGSTSSSDSLQLSDAPEEAGKAEHGGSEGKKKREKRPGMIRALSRRRTATSAAEITGGKGEDEVVPPVPRPQYRRHLSVPPSRSRRGTPTEEEISNGWTELDPLPSAPPRCESEKKEEPSPPTRIPHRYSSLPVRPERPLLNILTTLQVAPIPEHNTRPASSVNFGPCIHPSGDTGSERKRRFRRTLVEVEDDLQFQQLLQDEDKRGRDDGGIGEVGLGAECVENAGCDVVVGLAVTTNEMVSVSVLADAEIVESPPAVEDESDKHTIQAWFVTRELVQGEKRYGRLLARGVSIAQSVADRESSADFGSLNPSGLSSFFTSPTSLNKRSSKTPHSATSSPPSTLRGSSYASASHTRFSSTSSSSLSASRSSSLILSFPASIDETPPLDMLLFRLPRLLALSLTLSSRFAHDPSPDQVATAFLSMEDELLLELSQWAGEVGRLIATGFGELVDREMRGEGMSTRSSLVELTHSSVSSLTGEITSPGGLEEKKDRTSFSEILLAPIQRAARYRLLFQSLLNKIPRGSRGREKVQQALWAAERIVQGVNRGQGFDLEGLRRGSGGEEGALVMPSKREGGRGMGRRVRSMYT